VSAPVRCPRGCGHEIALPADEALIREACYADRETFQVWTGVRSPYCRCRWLRASDLIGFTMAQRHRACPIHGLNGIF